MINIVYRILIKEGQVPAFKQLAETTLIPEAQRLPGCELFSLFQNTANKREFIFYEKWHSEESVLEYKHNLITALGDPRPGEEFPERMNSLIEEDEDLV